MTQPTPATLEEREAHRAAFLAARKAAVRPTMPPAMQAILDRMVDPAWYGIDCGAGWYDLLADLDRTLAALHPTYTITQVKQKYGQLRYYLDPVPEHIRDVMREAIHAAEAQSLTVCEDCGASGELRHNPWIATLCITCIDRRLAEIEDLDNVDEVA